jgi:hypothetical protein
MVQTAAIVGRQASPMLPPTDIAIHERLRLSGENVQGSKFCATMESGCSAYFSRRFIQWPFPFRRLKKLYPTISAHSAKWMTKALPIILSVFLSQRALFSIWCSAQNSFVLL